MWEQALIDAKAQQLHDRLMATPTTPTGDPVYDRFFRYVASYQQAKNPGDYATLAAQCTEEVNTPGLRADMDACYTWLAWLARWRVETIVRKQ